MRIHNNQLKTWGVSCLLLLAVATRAGGQEAEAQVHPTPRLGIKSNLLYDATGTINLGFELRTGRRTSLDISGNYNAWTFSENRKWKHFLIQPEYRHWLCEPFYGHFIGAHAHYSGYNVGNLPFGGTDYEDHRYEGWLAGAGFSYGYHKMLSNRWSIEATIGVGYAYMDYDKYKCEKCGEKVKSGTTHYLGITKAAVSLIYIIK